MLDTTGGTPSQEQASSHSNRLLIAFALASMIATYVLVVLGSTVRVTESGMGCPSWPLCYGQLGPIDRFHTLLEELHRYMATIVSILVFATLALAWRRKNRALLRKAAAASAGLVFVQVMLGGLTVLAKNAPWTVAVHLLVAIAFLGVVTVTAIASLVLRSGHPLDPTKHIWGSLAIVFTYLLVISGTFVVDGGASKACPSWPLCSTSSAFGPVALNIVHRLLGTIAGITIVGFLWSEWKKNKRFLSWRTGSIILAILLILTGSVGAESALTRANPSWQDMHMALAAATWAAVVAMISTLYARGEEYD